LKEKYVSDDELEDEVEIALSSNKKKEKFLQLYEMRKTL
jgi:hypothetical protein